jgi:hypothetical protein
MRYYQSNPACHCGRCRTRGLMLPAVLITIGLLFLLDNAPGYPFERTWPILLIVIGAIKVMRYVMPDDSHWNPGQYGPPGSYPPPGSTPPSVHVGAVQNETAETPSVAAPPSMAGATGDGSGGDNEVHHG